MSGWCALGVLGVMIPSASLARTPKTPETPAVAGEEAAVRPCAPTGSLPAPPRRWRHRRSKLIARVGSARHNLTDGLARPEQRATLQLKLQYGQARKDLEDERARVFLHRCGRREQLATVRTDDDGRATITLPALPAGAYTIEAQVEGDGTTARAVAWVLPRGARVAVFDIDGTLTTSDAEVQRQWVTDAARLTGLERHDPRLIPGGPALTQAYAARGVVPIYLSGRPYWFDRYTRAWLDGHHMAPGPIVLTRHHAAVAPTEAGVGAFKLAQLQAIQAQGWRIVAAHGNATTDIFAYTQAKLPAGRIFIVGEHGGRAGVTAVRAGWDEVRARLDALLMPPQSPPTPTPPPAQAPKSP